MRNLIQAGYDGRLVPVNPRYTTIHGLEAYPSVAEVDDGVDLAVIAVHISTVPNIVKECVEAGVSGAIIISAGGSGMRPRCKSVSRRRNSTASW